jgi:hypothetical protein
VYDHTKSAWTGVPPQASDPLSAEKLPRKRWTCRRSCIVWHAIAGALRVVHINVDLDGIILWHRQRVRIRVSLRQRSRRRAEVADQFPPSAAPTRLRRRAWSSLGCGDSRRAASSTATRRRATCPSRAACQRAPKPAPERRIRRSGIVGRCGRPRLAWALIYCDRNIVRLELPHQPAKPSSPSETEADFGRRRRLRFRRRLRRNVRAGRRRS